MDFQMSSVTVINGINTFDLAINSSGILPRMTADQIATQQAMMATYLILNSIPQLQGQGSDWIGFFTGNIGFGELDAQIRNNIQLSGNPSYYPNYYLENDQLQVQILKG